MLHSIHMLTHLKYLILSLILLTGSLVFAQEYKLGDVTAQELAQKIDTEFPEASAMVLSRKVNLTIGRKVKVYEKIKIINKEGFDFGKITAQYYDIDQIQGATYNLVNGSIETIPLSNKRIFTQEDPFGNKVTSLWFTDIKEGSIIEYSYESATGLMADIILQDYLPIKKLSIEVNNRLSNSFTVTQNPLAKIPVNRFKRGNAIAIRAKNIPAIEPLDYVYDIDLFSAKLRIQDAAFNVLYDQWEDYARYIVEDMFFANQLRPSRIYKDDLIALIGEETDPLAKTKKVYRFIQDSIVWDQYYSTYPSRGTRTTYRDKIGDVADINSLLVSALRSLDLEAYLVLSATKFNGIPTEPDSEAFNYTLASVIIDDKIYTLDAANKEATFDYLPKNLINGRGLVILDRKTIRWIDLEQPTHSTLKIFNQATIDYAGTITGQTREQLKGYFAINFKQFLEEEYKFKNQIVRYDYKDIRVTNVKIDSSQNDLATLNYDFATQEAVTIKDHKMQIDPLLFLGLIENPFKKELRQFPVDFGFTQKREYLFNFEYPDTYTVAFIPEPINIALPNGLGTYSYQISPVKGALQVRMQMSINAAVLPVEFYAQLREFYRIRVAKEKENVVLVKRL